MEQIREQLKQAIKNLYNLDFDPELTPSPEGIDADYSTNAPLKLAKELHKPPMIIAEELGVGMEQLETSVSSKSVRVTDLEGDPQNVLRSKNFGGGKSGRTRTEITPPGFLNFKLSNGYLLEQINAFEEDFDNSIAMDEYHGKTVICEFSDPNPFKVLHVGHLYTSIVGDSISRLYEYAGAKVIRANFGGDVGLHVAKTMYALEQKDIKDLKIEDIAKCYIEGTALYDEDEHAHAEITKLNKEIYRINAAGEPKKVLSRSIFADGANTERPSPVTTGARERSEEESFSVPRLVELYWSGRELSYEYFNNFYAKIGVHFDKYYPESTVAALGLATVKEQLARGVYEMSDGAVIFDGDKFGLHTRVFINKEGVPTYEAKDVGLIFTKWHDYHFDKSIVITGNEQLDYMKVVLKSVEQYAPELVEKTTHLTHGLVKLPGGVKMSSRKGNFLKAVDVLDMIDEELEREYHSKDPKISLAATKYAFLKYKMGGNIIFDPKESVKMTGNSGPYLLYSAVRAKKILDKVASSEVNDIGELHNAQRVSIRDDGSERRSEPRDDGREQGGERVSIVNSSERLLTKKLLEYKLVLREAVTEMAPHKLANYLYELAQDFSRFYEHCQVSGSDCEAERLKLVKLYLTTMTHGLGLLGIEIPESM